MATSAISNYNLDSSYVGIIRNLMVIERQPLDRLEAQRDNIEIQKAIYSDLNGMLSAFQTSAKSLLSTDPTYSFQPGRTASLSGLTTGISFGSVSAGSAAVPASYELSVTNLAREHRVRSKELQYSTQQLGMSGSFTIGGAQVSAATSTASSSVNSISTAQVASTKTELGSGKYYVETRQNSGSWQFRLVDADGKAVSVKKHSAASDYTADWQNIPAGGGAYDTGRGLQIDFTAGGYTAGTRGFGAAEVNLTAKGASISVDATSTLVDIASSINNAKYAEGNEVVATIVNNQLLLSAKYGGDNRVIQVQDVTGTILNDLEIYNGSTFTHEMQTAASANFSVNGLAVKRSANTGLTDVINGVTLNLVKDSEGKTATLNVVSTIDENEKKIGSFVTEYNKLLSYLSAKIATTKNADDTYTRGALSGDMVFTNLRYDLLRLSTAGQVNAGSFTRLSELGITMSNDLKLSVSDSSKLKTALTNDRSSVISLLDSVMNQMNTKVSRFLGTSGYLTTASQAIDRQVKNTKTQISNLETRLSKREEYLYQQYAQLQSQIMTMTYQSQQFGSMYSKSY
jgi:flagellar hook-associated protein 2